MRESNLKQRNSSYMDYFLCSYTLPVCLGERREDVKCRDKLADVLCVCVYVRERLRRLEEKRGNKEYFYKKQSYDSPVHSADCLETLQGFLLPSPILVSGSACSLVPRFSCPCKQETQTSNTTQLFSLF